MIRNSLILVTLAFVAHAQASDQALPANPAIGILREQFKKASLPTRDLLVSHSWFCTNYISDMNYTNEYVSNLPFVLQDTILGVKAVYQGDPNDYNRGHNFMDSEWDSISGFSNLQEFLPNEHEFISTASSHFPDGSLFLSRYYAIRQTKDDQGTPLLVIERSEQCSMITVGETYDLHPVAHIDGIQSPRYPYAPDVDRYSVCK